MVRCTALCCLVVVSEAFFFCFLLIYSCTSCSCPGRWSSMVPSPGVVGQVDAWAGLSVMVLLFGEHIADVQQFDFQTEKWRRKKAGLALTGPYEKGFISTGLWGISRHPNYFCEVHLWWSFYGFSIAASGEVPGLPCRHPSLPASLSCLLPGIVARVLPPWQLHIRSGPPPAPFLTSDRIFSALRGVLVDTSRTVLALASTVLDRHTHSPPIPGTMSLKTSWFDHTFTYHYSPFVFHFTSQKSD